MPPKRWILPPWAAILVVIGAALAYLALTFVVGLGAVAMRRDADWMLWLTRAGLTASQVLTLLLIPMLVLKLTGCPLREGLSLRAVRLRPLMLTLVSVPALTGLAQATNIIAQGIMPRWEEADAFILALLRARSWGEYAVVLVVIALTPAVCEECLFRGVLQTSLSYRIAWFPAVMISSTCFLVIHVSPVQIVSITVLAMFLGMVVVRTGSLFYSIIIHGLNNAIAVSLGLFAVPGEGNLDLGQLLLGGAVSGLGVLLAVGLWIRLTWPPVVPGDAAALAPAIAGARPSGWQPVPPRRWRLVDFVAVAAVLFLGLLGNAAAMRAQRAAINIPRSGQDWQRIEEQLAATMESSRSTRDGGHCLQDDVPSSME